MWGPQSLGAFMGGSSPKTSRRNPNKTPRKGSIWALHSQMQGFSEHRLLVQAATGGAVGGLPWLGRHPAHLQQQSPPAQLTSPLLARSPTASLPTLAPSCRRTTSGVAQCQASAASHAVHLLCPCVSLCYSQHRETLAYPSRAVLLA